MFRYVKRIPVLILYSVSLFLSCSVVPLAVLLNSYKCCNGPLLSSKNHINVSLNSNSDYDFGKGGELKLFYSTQQSSSGIDLNVLSWPVSIINSSDASCSALNFAQVSSTNTAYLSTFVELGNIATTLPFGYQDTLVLNATVSYYNTNLHNWVIGILFY